MPSSTLTEFRDDIIALIEAEFQDADPDESTFVEVLPGKMPRLMGSDGAYAAVSPVRQAPRPQQMNDQEITVLVQFYLEYPKTKPIEPKRVLDPSGVEDVVERFQRAIEDNGRGSGTTSGRWYFNLTGVDYPDDPIGQKTRAEITLVAHGTNPAINLVETV